MLRKYVFLHLSFFVVFGFFYVYAAEKTYSNRIIEWIKIRLFCAYHNFRDQWEFLVLHSVELLNTISFLVTIGLQSHRSFKTEVNFRYFLLYGTILREMWAISVFESSLWSRASHRRQITSSIYLSDVTYKITHLLMF